MSETELDILPRLRERVRVLVRDAVADASVAVGERERVRVDEASKLLDTDGVTAADADAVANFLAFAIANLIMPQRRLGDGAVGCEACSS